MVILGLGSNLNNRLENLRNAFKALKKLNSLKILQVSPIYISDALLPENAPHTWDIPHLNAAIRCETNLEPLELLRQLKLIEISLGRNFSAEVWSPRIIDIDILAWDELAINTETLTIPHKELLKRPFALWPLADVAPTWQFPIGEYKGQTIADLVEHWGSRFTKQAPFNTQQIYQRLDTPKLIGVINVTPDSFSDGGKYFNVENALQHALDLVANGADVLDIGAESTAPRAKPLSPEQEWLRLEPILNALKNISFFLPPKISIDTRYPETAKQALDLGVGMINDVTGFTDPVMREIVAATNAECIVMHYLTIPASHRFVLPRKKDPLEIIREWALKQFEIMSASGINPERVILDPGIGFGKTADQSFELIKNFSQLANLDLRWLVGHSRKSFLSLFTKHPFAERDIETLVLSLHLANLPVEFLRVHNVEITARAFKIAQAL